MCKKVLSVTLAIIMVFGLLGCFTVDELILEPTFIPSFVRDSDGFEVRLGMAREEIRGNVRYQRGFYDNGLHIFYDNNSMVQSILSMSSTWSMAGISVWDNIQDVIASDKFRNLDYRIQFIDDDPEFINRVLLFYYGDYVLLFNHDYDNYIIISMGIFSKDAYLYYMGE